MHHRRLRRTMWLLLFAIFAPIALGFHFAGHDARAVALLVLVTIWGALNIPLYPDRMP